MSSTTYATIDQGNTMCKLGVFQDGNLIHSESHPNTNLPVLSVLLQRYGVEAVMYSSVSASRYAFDKTPANCRFIPFDSELKLPIEMGYRKNEKMGTDRIAAATGLLEYPGPLRVAVDFGTCTSITIVENHKVINGSISPGRWMKYRALHEFTGQLPLLTPPDMVPGANATGTEETLHNGVSTASALETEHLLHHLLNGRSPDSLVITGGDHTFFERHLKTPNFADPHLVLKGLHAILLKNL